VSTPFGRRELALVDSRRVGGYVVLAAVDSQARAEPGQFYMLASAERWGGGEDERPFLSRAMSVMRTGEDGSVEFMLEDVGPGTKRLCELRPGDALLASGPFGRGFSPPTPDTLLVGGGIGIAPLLGVQEQWGCSALLGFRDDDHAVAAGLFSEAEVATDDGSSGHHGPVTDLLDRQLEAGPRRIYACGPPAMLDAVRARARRHEVAAELALEAPMACGFGACYGCVVATVDGYRRVCVDGPVFDAGVLV
jgi:dihydroorotate dehydrogenase electron transfer subunit